MSEQYRYEAEMITYQIFPVMKSGGARLPLLIWIEGKNKNTEEQIQKNLQQVCKNKKINFIIISLKRPRLLKM